MADREQQYYEGYFDSVNEPRKERKHMTAGRTAVVILLALLAVSAGFFAVRLFLNYDVVVSGNNGGVSISIARSDRKLPEIERVTDAVTATVAPDFAAAAQADPPAGGNPTLRITTDRSAGQLSNTEIYEKTSRSVVSVTVSRNGIATGISGVVLTSGGHIITTCAAAQADFITVTLWDGRTFPAVLAGFDEVTDLAVLKINAEGLEPADFGDSDGVEVGETLYALGTLPNGTCFMTDGIASAIDGNVTIDGVATPLILTNADVRLWNTGGAMVNGTGKVIAIMDIGLSSIYGEETVLGCGIPVRIAKPVIEELAEKGYVSGRPALGLSTSDVPAAMSAYLGIPRGAMIDYVHPASEACEKGLSRGDIIINVNGIEITGTSELNSIRNSMHVGDTVRLGVFRDGMVYFVDLKLQDSSEVRR